MLSSVSAPPPSPTGPRESTSATCACPRSLVRAAADGGSALGSRALLRIRVDQGLRKSGCQRCNQACPMGIRVMEDDSLAGEASIDHPDCTRCGACVDACPREILSLCSRAGQ